MSGEYTTIEIRVMEDGSVRIAEFGETPTSYTSIEESIDGIKERLQRIQSEMHFESEHDPNET